MIKWETQNVNVVDLLLDDENIRLDDGRTDASQDALIHDLFINQNAFELVLSITRNGLFPHEIPITLRSGKRLTVIEGNRRIAALKAIIQPSLVPSHAGKIEKAKKDNLFVPIETLDVKVAPSRDAVQPLLAAIHTTESRKPWATLRQAYFYYAQIESTGRTISELIDEYPHVDVPRFVRMWEMHLIARSILYDSNEDAIKVADQQKFPITTLERIYNNESFRSKFGIVFDQHGRVTINAEPEGFKKAYKHLIEDILNNVVTSRSHNKTAEINRYVAQLPAAKMTDDITSTASPEFGPVAPKPKLRTPQGLAPKDITCRLNSPGVDRMLKELQHLDYRKFPNAAHDLLRTFLECSLKAYFADRKIKVKPPRGKYTYLDAVLQEAEHHFEEVNLMLVQPVKVIRGSAGNKTSDYLYSLDRLNAANHNPAVFSTGEQVKAAWDQMEDIFRFILNPAVEDNVA